MFILERVLIFAVPILPAVLLFYPIVFLVFGELRKETLSIAGHLIGFFSTWTFATVPGYLLGQGFYDWHPTVILITPTIAATLGVAIALSLFGESPGKIPALKAKTEGPQSDQYDEELLVLAWDEIENEKVEKGLWGKAFVDAGGDSEKTKSIYLALRVKQLDYERAPLTGHEETE